VKITADTITDDQVRALKGNAAAANYDAAIRAEDHVDGPRGWTCVDDVVADALDYNPRRSLRQRDARRRCADLLNTMHDRAAADMITDDEIRALRDRFGEGSRLWDPAIVHECDLALGEVEIDGDAQGRQAQARARCAEIRNARGPKGTR
jgi:hypothetical protein